jgi:hypothetical protein
MTNLDSFMTVDKRLTRHQRKCPVIISYFKTDLKNCAATFVVTILSPKHANKLRLRKEGVHKTCAWLLKTILTVGEVVLKEMWSFKSS